MDADYPAKGVKFACRNTLGGEPICRLLPIAPSTYYEVIAKRTDVDRLSARERNDVAMKVEIRRVFNENFQVYGVRKVWRQLQREGFDIARGTVARLMRMIDTFKASFAASPSKPRCRIRALHARSTA